MGLFYSSLKQSTIKGSQIAELDNDKVTINLNKNMLNVYYFETDILDECFKILSEIFKNKGSATIYHSDSKIFVIKNNSNTTSYASGKVSPTSFGWTLHK